MDNYFNYFTEVEEYFAKKRGKNLLVSPLDWCLIELWRDSGIPLNIVLRGIDRTFEKAEQKAKSAPRTLYYCHPAIQEAYEEHREAMLGKGDDDDEAVDERTRQAEQELSREQIAANLKRILGAIARREGDSYRRAARRIEALLEELGQARFVSYEEVDRELGEIGSGLAEDVLAEMDSELVKQLKKQVAAETRMYKKRLDKESFAKLQRSYLQRRLLEEEGLPPFALLL